MTPDARTVAEVAAGLRPAWRKALLSAYGDVPLATYDLQGCTPTWQKMIVHGLADRKRCFQKYGHKFWGYYLTSLGLAVKAHLEQST